MNTAIIEYPALVYKNSKNNVFVANCIMKKLIGFGKTETEALNNLENVLSKIDEEFSVRIKPIYNLISSN